MNENYKPGGGNKMQPYIPKGNGKESGEYTDKPMNVKEFLKELSKYECLIFNKEGKYNFKKSKLVKKVVVVKSINGRVSIPRLGTPNSVIKRIVDGLIVSERYYNENGDAYLDIDYTCHQNPKTHPYVPHIHIWYYDENRNLKRSKMEKFLWE